MAGHKKSGLTEDQKIAIGIAIVLALLYLYFNNWQLPCAAFAIGGGWGGGGLNATPTPGTSGYTCGWQSSILHPTTCGGTCRPPYVCAERLIDDERTCDCYNPGTGNWDPDFPGVPFPTPTPIATPTPSPSPTPNMDQPSCDRIESFMCPNGYCSTPGYSCQTFTNQIEEDYCACAPASPCGSLQAPICNGACDRGYICEIETVNTGGFGYSTGRCACVPYSDGTEYTCDYADPYRQCVDGTCPPGQYCMLLWEGAVSFCGCSYR